MLSKKIFISKLVPPQKLPSWVQAAPRAHGRALHPRDTRVAPHGTPHPLCAQLRAQLCHPGPPPALLRGGSAGGEVIPMEWQPRQLCLFLTWLQALGTEWHRVIFVLMQPLPRCDAALDAPQMGTVSPGWPRRVLPSLSCATLASASAQLCPCSSHPTSPLNSAWAGSQPCCKAQPPPFLLGGNLCPRILPHTSSLPRKANKSSQRWIQVVLLPLALLPQLWT